MNRFKKYFSLLLVFFVSLCLGDAMSIKAADVQFDHDGNEETAKKTYTTDDNGKIAYSPAINGKIIDVIGNYGGQWILTTYGSAGYRVMTTNNDLEITATGEIVNSGMYVKLIYTLKATSDVTDAKFAVYADVKIANNDRAAVEIVKNSNGNVVGFKMIQDNSSDDYVASYNAQYNLLFANTYGVTSTDNYWFGAYNDRVDETDDLYSKHVYEKIDSTTKSTHRGTYNADLTSYSGNDSALAVSWHGINLSENETKIISILVGVGEVADAPTVVSEDPEIDASTKKVEGSITSTNPETGSMYAYYSVDNGSSIEIGSTTEVTHTFDYIIENLTPGTHVITVYTMNDKGAVSDVKNYTVTIPGDNENNNTENNNEETIVNSNKDGSSAGKVVLVIVLVLLGLLLLVVGSYIAWKYEFLLKGKKIDKVYSIIDPICIRVCGFFCKKEKLFTRLGTKSKTISSEK